MARDPYEGYSITGYKNGVYNQSAHLEMSRRASMKSREKNPNPTDPTIKLSHKTARSHFDSAGNFHHNPVGSGGGAAPSGGGGGAPTGGGGGGLMAPRRAAPAAPTFTVRPRAVREAAAPVGLGGDTGPGGRLPGVSGRLQTLLDSDSPYLDRARTRARQVANRRGLLNSSIAAGAGEAAAIDAALPIASGDAQIAAGERAMRSQEFQQYRSIRSQELMQQRGLTHDAAQREADRELQDLMQRRNLYVQMLMQERGMDHSTASQMADQEFRMAMQQGSQAFQASQAALGRQFARGERVGSQEFAGQQAFLDREAARLAQERGISHSEGMAEAQRIFAGRQADLDREAQRIAQERGITHSEALAEAQRNLQRNLANEAAVRDINSEYQRNLTILENNQNIPIERRQELQDHYAHLRDQAIAALSQIYDYVPTWAESVRRPEPEAEAA